MLSLVVYLGKASGPVVVRSATEIYKSGVQYLNLHELYWTDFIINDYVKRKVSCFIVLRLSYLQTYHICSWKPLGDLISLYIYQNSYRQFTCYPILCLLIR